MSKKKSSDAFCGPAYPLPEVRKLIGQGRVKIRPNARTDAFNDFGWDTTDILEALKTLQERHFHKRDVSTRNTWNVYDFYKAYGLSGENVYTHFYIDQDDYLVVNSFKKI
jgi:hypothetical protein